MSVGCHRSNTAQFNISGVWGEGSGWRRGEGREEGEGGGGKGGGVPSVPEPCSNQETIGAGADHSSYWDSEYTSPNHLLPIT